MTMASWASGTALVGDDATVGVLVSRLTEQISQLIRNEFRLGQPATRDAIHSVRTDIETRKESARR